jgi:hypothetical protein
MNRAYMTNDMKAFNKIQKMWTTLNKKIRQGY